MLEKWLNQRLKVAAWTRSTPPQAPLRGLVEMPRFPIRSRLLIFLGAASALSVAFWHSVGNPLASVRDPRRATQYNDQPLNSLAARRGMAPVWVGSDGGGLKVLDSKLHYWRQDITRGNSQLLGDHILDLDLAGGARLAAIALAGEKDSPGGVQLASFDFRPNFWTKPVIDLSRFVKVNDRNAGCVVATADGSHLVIGTRGHGLGIYAVQSHAWTGVISTKHGLPSDRIQDLASVARSDSETVLWVATDKGLSGGPLARNGQLSLQWHYEIVSGLAGQSIKRLELQDTNLWYVTEKGGAGRLRLNQDGSPAAVAAAEVLVTERSMPGLDDRSFRLARGSSTSRDTWFLTESGVGRHRELPFDTLGVPFPTGLSFASVTCVATDPYTARALYVGTDDGGYAFVTPDAPLREAMPAIESGFVGPDHARVVEAAMVGRTVVARHLDGAGVSGLRSGQTAAKMPWAWTDLVGTARFPGLNDSSDITCLAGGGGQVYFGTAGKGIGVWNRAGMEVRRTRHSSSSDPAHSLRSDFSLDLAVFDRALIQVTQDHAVDWFADENRGSLVPPDAAPMRATEVTAATAFGTMFACAAGDQIGLYNAAKFTWTRLPPVGTVAGLKVTQSALWVLTTQDQLYNRWLADPKGEWKLILTGVMDVAASAGSLQAISRHDDGAVAFHTFSGENGEETFFVAPRPLQGSNGKWRFALTESNQFWLIGDRAGLDHYDLSTRAWNLIEFPEAIKVPVAAAVRSARSWWLLDAEHVLHRFNMASRTFDTELQSNVERVDASIGTAIAVGKLNPQAPRLTRFSDASTESQTLVGRPFQEDPAAIADAIETRGNLVIARGDQLGLYDWTHHDWASYRSPGVPVTRFLRAGDAIWAMCGQDRGSLHYWNNSELKRLTFEGNAIEVVRTANDREALVVLDSEGRLLEISTAAPTSAKPLLASKPFPETWPKNPAGLATLTGWLAVGGSNGLHFYGPATGPGSWRTVSLGQPVKRLISTANGKRLVIEGANSAWWAQQPSESAGDVHEFMAAELAGGGRIAGLASGDDVVAGAVQMPGETGKRLWTLGADIVTQTLAIGAPCPSVAPTKAVLQLGEGNELLRLDVEGRVTKYSIGDHSWVSETTSGNLDNLWQTDGRVMGYDRQKKSLAIRAGDNNWTSSSVLTGRIENAQPFRDGVVLTLPSRGVGWYAVDRFGTARTAGQPSGFPAPFGKIIDAAEGDEMLVLLDDAGHLTAFDWAQQAWLKYEGTNGRALLRAGGHCYLLADHNRRKTLFGPLRSSGDRVVAANISGQTGLRNASVAGDALFCVTDSGAIMQAKGGELVPVWGGTAARTSQPGTLLAAEQVESEGWLLITNRLAKAQLLKVDSNTLESRLVSLPDGIVERVFRAAPGVLAAVMVSTNGRYPLNLVTLLPIAPPLLSVEEIGVRDGAVVAVTPQGLLHAVAGAWAPIEKMAGPVPAEVRAQLLSSGRTNLGTLLVTNVTSGGRGWLSASNSNSQVVVLLPQEQGVVRLSPASDGSSLAHEQVREVLGVRDVLYAATDGGVVELHPSANRLFKHLHNEAAGALLERVKSLHRGTNLLCQTTDDRYFRLVGTNWLPTPAPDASAVSLARGEALHLQLTNWKADASLADLRTWERRFSTGMWRRVRLGAAGFDFETSVAAAWVSRRLEIYTPAGTVLFAAGNGSVIPDDLLPTWATPPGLAQAVVLQGPDDAIFLSHKAEDSTELLWIRGNETWQAASAEDKEVASRLAKGPLLTSDQFTWSRPQAGQRVETVEWRSGGVELAGNYSPAAGRFDWDTCWAVGQAQAQVWILSAAGLFRIDARGIIPSSRVPVPGATELFVFAGISGDMPGALLDGKQKPVLTFNGKWTAPDAVGDTAFALARFRHRDTTWRTLRDGVVERCLPQAPTEFAPVRVLGGGRWDFESVADVAVDDQVRLLATRFGVVSIAASTGEWRGMWPMPAVSEIALSENQAIAQTSSGRRALVNGVWVPSASSKVLHPATLTDEGVRFRIERRFPGVSVEVRLREGDVFRSAPLASGGFAFDNIRDAAVGSDAVVVSATPAGLVARAANGDLTYIATPALGMATISSFRRVPQSDRDSAVHAITSDAGVLTQADSWRRLSSARAQQLQRTEQVRLAWGSRWRITQTPSGIPDFSVQLANEPADVWRSLPMIPQKGGFGIDQFICVAATDAQGRILIGSAGGLERLDSTGKLERLWTDAESRSIKLDGLGPVAINGLVRGANGGVQIQSEENYFEIPPGGDLARPSTKSAFDTARSVQANAPAGWSVSINHAAGLPLRTRWKGQPVFLVDSDRSGACFAHNLVHAALTVGDELWLASEGGLVILPSVDPNSTARMSLVVAPFQRAGAESGVRLPEAFGWLGFDTNGAVLARPLKRKTDLWRLPATDPNSAERMATAASPRLRAGAQDDLLRWEHSDLGRVKISFVPGRAVPDGTLPRIQAGTFSFLDLDLPSPRSRTNGIAVGTNRFFAATAGGVLEFESTGLTVTRVHAKSAAPERELSDLDYLFDDPVTHALLAGSGRERFKYDLTAGRWLTQASGNDVQPNRSLWNLTPRLSWRGKTVGMQVGLQQTDQPDLPVFIRGKPAIDEVFDLVCRPGTNGGTVLLGTAGGVAVYRAEDAEYLTVQAAAFARIPGDVTPVVELARAEPPEGPAQFCARDRDRAAYVLTQDQWQVRTNLDELFELGYRKVLQTNQWSWSRHPSGLSMTLLNVNGPDVLLGQGLDASRPPIFSRGKMSMDDARCVALTETELFVGTPVGLARFELHPGSQGATYKGLDFYGGNEGRSRMTNVAGLFHNGGLLVWNSSSVFTNRNVAAHHWDRTPLAPDSLFVKRSVIDGEQVWGIEPVAAPTPELKVSLREGGRQGEWHVPGGAAGFRSVATSDDGFWFLSDNLLYRVDREHLRRSWRR